MSPGPAIWPSRTTNVVLSINELVHGQLAALTLQAEIAEATARLVTAEQSVALGRRRTSDHLRATEEMAAALSAQSVNVSLAAPPLVCPAEGSELVRVLHALEERHREERRAAEAREERYPIRRRRPEMRNTGQNAPRATPTSPRSLPVIAARPRGMSLVPRCGTRAQR